MSPQRKIVFVSTNCDSPWGGSEELWSEAACQLSRNHLVSASVHGWPKPAARLGIMRQKGVDVHERQFGANSTSVVQKLTNAALRRVAFRGLRSWLKHKRPDLICISIGSPADDLDLMNVCTRIGCPYAIIVQANSETIWPDDERARTLTDIFGNAKRLFFVSERNHDLLETQLGVSLPLAHLVRNPFKVRYDVELPWPNTGSELHLACIARLEPRAKGQDLVLRLLAREPWKSRPITLSLYGSGHMEQGLRRLAARLDLGPRVRFCGHVEDIESVWAEHHALILPSRYEGLPLALVEAMLCGRPAIVTDVAGNAELVKEGISGFVAEAATESHLDRAMERAWNRRVEWQQIGAAAAAAVRKSIPADPPADLVRLVLEICE
jgi:glycosyltransferase involved in cell wall biosynthesis